MSRFAMVDGVLVPEHEARVSIFDRGFLYGDAAFETVPVYGGRMFRAAAHLLRLTESLQTLRIAPPLTADQCEAAIERLLGANAMRDAIVRITVTRGAGERGPRITGAERPTVVIACFEPKTPPEEWLRRGIRLAVAATRKVAHAAVPARLKSANYLNNILARAEASDAGADEALLLDDAGALTECSASNVFLVRGGTLLTPSLACGVLPGVTRAAVLELARAASIAWDETRLGLEHLRVAEEVFITNSIAGLLPVRAVDATHYCAPGPLTRQLSSAYWRRVAHEAGPPWASPSIVEQGADA